VESIAVIGGTGKEGFGLAVRWAKAGRPVIIGSRAAAKAREAAARAAEQAGCPVTGHPNRDAAQAAGIVVLTIPYGGHAAILDDLRPVVNGKVVVDTTVPLAQYAPPVLAVIPEGSAAAHVQARLPHARVVAALHSVSSAKLGRFDQPLDDDVLVCGDDPAAKGAVIELVQALGMRGLDAGGLDAAGTLERLAALIIGMNQRYRRRAIGIHFSGI